MNNRIDKKISWIMTIGFVICLLAGSADFAVAHGGGRFHDGFRGGGFHGYGFGGYRHGFFYPHTLGGFFIGSQWFWGPTVVMAGVPYYYYSGVYYIPDGDYLVATVPPTVAKTVVAPAQSLTTDTVSATTKKSDKLNDEMGDTVVVNVPNEHGGYTGVKLVRSDKGYIGPQGEYYPNHPTVNELKVLYGK
jgi:hypothetical protein